MLLKLQIPKNAWYVCSCMTLTPAFTEEFWCMELFMLWCYINPYYYYYYYYYYYWYSALGPVWAKTRVQSGDWYSSGTLHPGQVLRGSLPLLSPAFLYVSTFHHQVPPRPPRRERSQRRKWELWVILPKWRLPRHLGIFYMPQIYDMGPTALLPLRRKACWGFFRP